METPPRLPDEPLRLAALHGLRILDTPPEERFDRITRLAQHLFDVPIVLVSLVDTDRQWFKSCQGLLAQQTSRDVSFCAHAIARPEPMVITDARLDVRFADNPLVTGEPHIRFYAGCPVQGPNEFRIGTLCLIDRRPRLLDEGQIKLLKELGAMVEDQLHLINSAELAHEVQQRRRIEAELRAAEERSRLLLESSGDGIYGIDRNGRCMFINRAATTLLGWSAEEVLGRNIHEVAHHSYPDGIPYPVEACPIARTFQGGESCRRDTEVFWRRDGTAFPIQYSSFPVHDACNAVSGAVVTFTDITQRKQGELALQEARKAAEDANRAKSEFLANMSHEIRTPMNGILGMTELALETDLTAEQRDYLEMVKGSADALLTVINDILDFSKIEAGKIDLEAVAFDPCELIGDTMKTQGLRAAARRLDLAWQAAPTVPATVVGDPTRLRQVVVNLIGNAIKFTDRGEVVLSIDVDERTSDAVLLHFTVRDTGPGIPREKHEAIFRSFEQADTSTTRQYGGTGLGLTISARLVELMGGHIWVESEPGTGSTFHFNVRCGTVPAAGQPSMPSELRGVPVLLVENSSIHHRILQDLLSQWQMRPTVVVSGAEARAALEREAFALLLADAIDGFSLVEEVRRRPALAHLPVILLSAAGQKGDAARCAELGVVRYLLKPVKPSDLLQAIRTALRSGPSKAAASQPAAPADNHKASYRVLLAEDNVVNQRLAVRILQNLGHQVEVVPNGREALNAIGRTSFDVVLMDVQMPEMDGFEATGLLREQEKTTRRHLPVIALTAHAMQGDRERCLQAGCDGYLAKPFDADALREVLESVVPPTPDGVARS